MQDCSACHRYATGNRPNIPTTVGPVGLVHQLCCSCVSQACWYAYVDSPVAHASAPSPNTHRRTHARTHITGTSRLRPGAARLLTCSIAGGGLRQPTCRTLKRISESSVGVAKGAWTTHMDSIAYWYCCCWLSSRTGQPRGSPALIPFLRRRRALCGSCQSYHPWNQRSTHVHARARA